MITTRHLRKLANQGDADAQFRLGYRFAFARKRERVAWSEAARAWTAAAAQEHPRAEFYLATCYDLGRGVRKDLSKAMRLYRSAAEKGHATDRGMGPFGIKSPAFLPDYTDGTKFTIPKVQPNGPANGSQPIRSETNGTSSAAGFRR